MNPVVQQEVTGCAIAIAATIAGISYPQAKRVANHMGIHADNPALWSETGPVRRLLERLGIGTDPVERPFSGWEALPDCAILATKWHIWRGRPHWHWVVFVREAGRAYVLDSKKELKTQVRTDFGRIKPRWYIPVRP
ncbi:MAG: hypothetical protein HZA24_04525 [Nitrospirae bacterium]|nr:hypothetical protein [Nitrospirota bacterium]